MSAPPSAAATRWRWRDLLWIALALVAVVALRTGQSDYEQRDAPLLQSAPAARAVGRNFAVEVGRLKVARAYLLKGDFARPEDRTLRSPGVWLSVLAKVEALQRPGYLSAQIRTRDGLVYVASNKERPKLDGFNLSERELAPGLPESGAWFFELPPDQLEGAHLQLYWGSLLPVGGDSLVDVDLRLDKAAARKLLADAKPVLDLRL
ncbi:MULTISPECIES: hypothetical protein [unclassified Lysobacter]|uniref:hypothetical protein n=1 Tax=unclassified Lysobacter TaxID=2635362 RepID=UPI000701E65A|nr:MULTISPECIES: hypothetical protein [unclassified Lysobacter]KRC34666.1 hypothetical protein ASE10_08145 [Lysobacter sp. Root76]KRD70355.1 hypothetical protein ASE45_00310 [Lysobacter sp. Root96]